ncbi:transcriptional regulator PpsR [Yoonia litorea]|uniref:transcriptional regulator PpsR n=1 Tax=Yoonia litorea TaxID=1123755 RepID=UPI000B2AA413|nr:transcriptional regulator PpsR [Yoonia litorea]
MTSRGTKYWNSGAIPLIAPEILGDIIAQVADVGVVISEDGEVLSVLVNPSATTFKGLDLWEGNDIRNFLTDESNRKFDVRLAEFLDGAENVRPIELNHADGSQLWGSPVRYSFHRIGPDGAILLLGRDLQPIADMQQQLVEAQLTLERDYEDNRGFDTRFRVLMESVSDAIVFVSVHTGQVIDANSAAATLIDRPSDRAIGSNFQSFFDVKKSVDMVQALANHAISPSQKPFSAMLDGKGGQVEIVPVLYRAAGEKMLLCRLLPAGESVARTDDLNSNVLELYHAGPEAIVFVSDTGDILSANDAFLDILHVGHDISLRGRSFADYLQRGTVDFKVMTENAQRAGRMRNYATKMAGDYGSPRAVEISVTKLTAGSKLLFAFVIRDAAKIDPSQSKATSPSDDSMRSVVELVGSATLKDIVAETTNVVEKMCIETAVELTMNNRVAAAEMLGLSRQSLYVKLRKFDLLNRDTDDE